MSLSVADLPWLPPAPPDLSSRIRAVGGQPDAAGSDLQSLAGYALTPVQETGFARALKRLRDRGADLSPLVPFRLGLLAANTYDLIADALIAGAARHGVALELIVADYGQVAQQALDSCSPVNTAHPDAVLVAVDHRWFGLDRAALDGPDQALDTAVAQLRAVLSGLRAHGAATPVLQTLAAPGLALFGNLDRRTPGTVRALIDAFNALLPALADEFCAVLLDTGGLAERIGTDAWFDPVHWHGHKLPFAPRCASAYGDLLGRVLGAMRGRARKCLVLDLDNTLWGGAIGDEGVAGIRLGQGDGLGEAFQAVQRLAADLRSRGVILAVASRNDEAVALEAFRGHAEMVLCESDIAAFEIHWQAKSGSLERIARRLNIGLDALVFLDDNPAERAEVRAALPMVAVPEVPSDPSWYPWMVTAAGYFESVSISAEDRLRATSYAADTGRQQVRAAAADMTAYLEGLDMRLALAPFAPADRARVTQLINKTNQFNLTTRRRTEVEVAMLEQDRDVHTLQARLEDRFGALGLIGVTVCTAEQIDGEPAWLIDTWLMSCRVLGRRVEEAVLARLAQDARAAGVRRLIGVFRPTARNAMVADHYVRLGFGPAAGQTDDEQRFVLDVDAYAPPANLPFAG